MSTSPVPVIEISLAPQEEPQPEPYSPFTPMNAAFSIPADDPYRPALLTPPAISWSLSSSHKTTPASQKGRGINDEDFQALLRASKERSSTLGTRKHDLRKEVALKAHKSRQVERRALFLSKIGAPPSPSAVSMPKTPPDSPAIFHYSLPSPGLMSPLALFEKLGLEDRTDESAVRKVWVEQVDFRLPKRFEAEPEFGSAASAPAAIPTITVTSTPALPEDRRRKGHARKPSLPSLEQITERYTSQTSAAPTALPTPARARAPLPAFLQTRRSSPSPPPEEAPAAMPAQTAEAPRPRLTSTGRIRVRSHTPLPSPSPPPHAETSKALPPLSLERSFLAPSSPAPGSPCHRTYELPTAPVSPLTPSSPRPPTLQITTTHVPRTSSSSPIQLTEANLLALNSRARTARDMLCAVRRRTAVYGRPHSLFLTGADEEKCVGEFGREDDEKCRRRISAPAELPRRERAGFTHPVLSLDGGF